MVRITPTHKYTTTLWYFEKFTGKMVLRANMVT